MKLLPESVIMPGLETCVTIERAVILARESKLAPQDLPLELQSFGDVASDDSISSTTGMLLPLEKVEEMYIRRALAQTKSIMEAAEILGIDQTTLYRKRKRIGLE